MSVVFGIAAIAAASAAGDTIQDIVGQVSQASYTDYLNNSLYTHDGDNRGIGGTEHDLARTNIYNAFSGFGLTTSLDPFTYGGNTYSNVVGVHEGSVYSDQIYIVGAHYDSVSNPGADDNASGVAGVLEAARVLSQYSFEATLVFMAFDREEQGLVGSRAYAADHSADDIRGMISLDMIAYNPVGPNEDMARIYYDDDILAPDPIPQITSDLAEAMALYSGGLSTEIARLGYEGSDHASFADVGFESALLIEYGVSSNPYYHQPTDSVDTVGYIDYEYATQMTRGTVGYLARAANAVPEPGIATLLGSGLLVVGLGVWRRRRQAYSPSPDDLLAVR
jgi:Zn-dependent M28 family amino/carboxypeptidase